MTEKTLCNQASKITENWKKTGRKIWLSQKYLDPFLTVTLGSRFLIENIEKWPKTAKNDQKSRFLSEATKGFSQFIPPICPQTTQNRGSTVSSPKDSSIYSLKSAQNDPK